MELFLLRHGKAVDPYAWARSDAERPLTPEGKLEVRLALQALRAQDRLPVEAIWSSPFVRAVETAQIAAQVLGAPMRISEALRSGQTLFESLPELEGDFAQWPGHLLCVGHQPDLGELLMTLSGDTARHASFVPGGAACLQGLFARAKMRLAWQVSPKDVLA